MRVHIYVVASALVGFDLFLSSILSLTFTGILLQHAGVVGVNPGEAVFIEGAETLVQWRRMFFGLYGVKYCFFKLARAKNVFDCEFQLRGCKRVGHLKLLLTRIFMCNR